MELTAANVQHLNRLTTQLDTALTDIEKQLDSQTDTEISSLWKTTQTTTQQNLKTLHDNLKIQRNNKMTKILKAHKLGKVYTNHQTTPRTDQHMSACAKPSSQTRNQSTNSLTSCLHRNRQKSQNLLQTRGHRTHPWDHPIPGPQKKGPTHIKHSSTHPKTLPPKSPKTLPPTSPSRTKETSTITLHKHTNTPRNKHNLREHNQYD